MRNIEIKVRHPDLESARQRAAALGAHFVWTRPQRDTYFAVRGVRLKVREMPDRAELIVYRRADAVTPRASAYELLPLRDAAATRALLGAAWPVAGVVDKRRELWRWQNVRIHLDRVEALGTFIELEGVIGTAADEGATRKRVQHVAAALRLARCEAVPKSYGDLIVAGQARR